MWLAAVRWRDLMLPLKPLLVCRGTAASAGKIKGLRGAAVLGTPTSAPSAPVSSAECVTLVPSAIVPFFLPESAGSRHFQPVKRTHAFVVPFISALFVGLALDAASWTIEATNARIHTVGIAVPGGWNLFSNGELGDYDQVRAEAARREEQVLAESDAAIERNRKGDAVIRVVDASGRPLPNTEVVVEQTRHEFLFGCNIYGFDHFKTEAQREEYKS
jgi:hypothetical protein